MRLTPYAIRNKKNFKKNGKSKKALARFPPTTVLNNCITPELNPCPACTYVKNGNAFSPKIPPKNRSFFL
jgi:hypothetical protein